MENRLGCNELLELLKKAKSRQTHDGNFAFSISNKLQEQTRRGTDRDRWPEILADALAKEISQETVNLDRVNALLILFSNCCGIHNLTDICDLLFSGVTFTPESQQL